MKSIKMLGLAAMAALMAMALVGAGSAMAESTQLCNQDETPCTHPTTTVHETSIGKATLLSSSLTVECNVLFSGTVGALGAPQIVEGKFSYSSCGSCTVTEVGTGSTIEVLKTGTETANVTGEGEVHVECFGFINCVYNGENLLGSAKGALLAGSNGEISLQEQTTNRVKGSLCPATAKLDIKTTPLAATYIRG